MKTIPLYVTLLTAVVIGSIHFASAEKKTSDNKSQIKGWKKGVGWGWIWGKDDEVGAFNAMTDESQASALRMG